MPIKLDDASFGKVYRTYWMGLYDFVLAKIHDTDAAEEIIQDLFSVLWEKRNDLQITNLKSYLYAAARNRVIDHYKQRLFSNLEEVDHSHDPEYPLFLAELEAQLQDALTKLPEKTREIFVLSRLEGKSANEISSLLNLPKRTVEYHLTQGMRFLRTTLKGTLLLVSPAFSLIIF